MSVRTFFFNAPATTEIYTLSLHDALPIFENVFFLPGLGRLLFQAIMQRDLIVVKSVVMLLVFAVILVNFLVELDRKSTRLNSSHSSISYAVFCLKKKNKAHQRLGDVDGSV